VDDPVERLVHLPDLLDAKFPALRVGAVQVEVIESRAGQVPKRPLGEHGRLGDQVRAGLKVGELLPLLAPALVAGAHAAHDPFLDQQFVGGRLAEDVDTRLLCLLGQEPAEARD
jgi:hypothetical protein